MAFCTKNIAILLVDVSKSSVLLCIFVKIVENMNPNLLNFLEKDVLKNIVLLKMLHSYGDQIETHFQQVDGSSAVLLLLPTHAFYYDAQTYPQTNLLCFSQQTICPQTLDFWMQFLRIATWSLS